MDVYGLIGNPVGHSLSPPMHEAGYDELGLDARYVTFEPAPDAAARAVEAAATLGVRGLNVTIPFKRDVLGAVDADPLAARIGAVNTIDLGPAIDADDGAPDATNRDGARPRGYNTDAAGVTRAFAHHGVDPSGAEAVVIGAGGAGRAAAFALADADASVHVANRTAERARDLAEDVPNATGGGLDDLADRVAGADLLVNATSVGMESPEETPVPAAALHADLSVLDAVYTPIRTRLLRDAADAGATTIDGAWMLLFQGVEAFEIWTGTAAPVESMNAALRDRLG